MYAYRKPGITPEEFQHHYENVHLPLVQALTGSLFPQSHTRLYIQRNHREGGAKRNQTTPATVLNGTQELFNYDAVATMKFSSQDAFQAFCEVARKCESNGPLHK